MNVQQEKEALKNLLGERTYERTAHRLARVEREGLATPYWNWSVFLFGVFWMVYRGLGGLALSYWLSLSLLATVITRYWTAAEYFIIYAVLAKLLLPMFVDTYVYWRIGRRLDRLRATGNDPVDPKFKYLLAPVTEYWKYQRNA